MPKSEAPESSEDKKVNTKPKSVKPAVEPVAVSQTETPSGPVVKSASDAPAAGSASSLPVTPVVSASAPVSGGTVAPADNGSRNTKGLAIKVGAVVVGLAAVTLAVFGVLIYAYKSDNPVVRDVAKVVPYPVQRVNGHFVSYNDYLFEVDANKRAYQNNAKLNNQPAVDFTTADGKKLVVQIKQHSLDKLESDALVAQLASQKKVVVTDKEVDDLINKLYQQYGGKDTLLKTLNQIYGWNLNDLKGVVRKQILAQNLQNKVTSDPTVDAAAKAKAQDVLAKVKAGGDFSALAKQYSQASDAASGGDMGFFTKGQLPDNEQAAAEALQPGQVSDVIKVSGGYVILKVVEKKTDGSIHAQEILIKTIDFNQYFQDQLKKAKVNNYIKV